MDLKPIQDQVAVIFGASSGIGRATAVEFARRGARVVVSARSQDGLNSLVETITSFGGQAVARPAEVTDFEQVRAVAQEAVDRYGRLDTWVHLAATSLYGTLEQTTPEEFRRVIDVNLVGQAYGAMAALPHIRREGRGALIHVSSVEANVAMPLQSAYAASKHGVKGLVDSLRRELEGEGAQVSVTNVMPAGINTPLFNKAKTKMGVKPKPVPPIYDAETVAQVIVYAAEHPVPEIYAGGAARMFTLNQKFAPRMVDRVLARMGLEGQKSSEPKAADGPDGFYRPISDNRVAGDFTDGSRGVSVYNWLETHPAGRMAIAASAFGAMGWLAARMARARS